MAEIDLETLADLKSKARAFDEMRAQKSDVNKQNQGLKAELEKANAKIEELSGKVESVKDLDPKAFDALKKENETLGSKLSEAESKASTLELNLLGMKHGLRDDPDALQLFGSKLTRAKAEANGDFDIDQFVTQAKEQSPFLFAGTEQNKPSPRPTPGGKGSAASSGGSELKNHIAQLESKIAEVSKSPFHREQATALRFQLHAAKQALMSEGEGA